MGAEAGHDRRRGMLDSKHVSKLVSPILGFPAARLHGSSWRPSYSILFAPFRVPHFKPELRRALSSVDKSHTSEFKPFCPRRFVVIVIIRPHLHEPHRLFPGGRRRHGADAGTRRAASAGWRRVLGPGHEDGIQGRLGHRGPGAVRILLISFILLLLLISPPNKKPPPCPPLII